MCSKFCIFLSVVCLSLRFSLADHSFVEIDPELRRQQRNLLENNEEATEGTVSDNEPKENKKKGKFEPGEYLLGPKVFYDGGHFAMEVGSPIKVTIFEGENHKKELSNARLKSPAMSVKGSMITADKTDFKVNLDWKQQDFGTTDFKISSIQINMFFKKKGSEYHMYTLEVVKLVISSKNLGTISFEVEDKEGFKIRAPVGSSFACSDLGMFSSAKNETGPYRIGITLPDVQLQVFNVKHSFGPAWDCDVLLSPGLLVGLVITLFFATVCFWGLSMLASINTMDRFDDPKGKQIYVAQTDG